MWKIEFGHFLRGRLLKGRCNIRVYVPVRVPVCVPPLPPPRLPPVQPKSRIPPHTPTEPLKLVPASVPASNCVAYPWEELPLKKCPINTPNVFGSFSPRASVSELTPLSLADVVVWSQKINGAHVQGYPFPTNI